MSQLDEIDVKEIERTEDSALLMLKALFLLPWSLFCVTVLEPVLGLEFQNLGSHVAFITLATVGLLLTRKKLLNLWAW